VCIITSAQDRFDQLKENRKLTCVPSIGCITTPKDFAVAGTATDKLYGVAEGLWEPDLVRRAAWR